MQKQKTKIGKEAQPDGVSLRVEQTAHNSAQCDHAAAAAVYQTVTASNTNGAHIMSKLKPHSPANLARVHCGHVHTHSPNKFVCSTIRIKSEHATLREHKLLEPEMCDERQNRTLYRF